MKGVILRAGWFLLAMVALMLGNSGCCGVITCVPPPAAPCLIEMLLIDESAVPGEWKEQGTRSARGAPVQFGVERIGTVFSTPIYGGGGQEVYRAWDKHEASRGYHDFMSYFSVREEETEWQIPPEITYHSQVADQSRLGCSTHLPSGVQRCQFIAQYEAYIVRFDTDMSEVMTYAGFERILWDIDRRMAECLERSK